MKPYLLPFLLVAFGSSFTVNSATADLPNKPHRWKYITYPETSLDDKPCPKFLVGYGEKNQGLRLDIRGFGTPAKPFSEGSIIARVHRASGRIAETTFDRAAGGFRNEWVSIAYFPWGSNTLSESWIEVLVGRETYWLEIPYGFDRNPEDSLPPIVNGGRPKVAAAMGKLRNTDHVVPWSTVHYDLGGIQNGWKLSLIQSNPFDARSEVVLYREDSAVGKSMFLWDLRSPRTTVRLRGLERGEVKGRCMSLRLHDDGMRRSDSFEIGRNGSDAKRGWATIEIAVDEKAYQITVPTSVTSYTHGHADVKE